MFSYLEDITSLFVSSKGLAGTLYRSFSDDQRALLLRRLHEEAVELTRVVYTMLKDELFCGTSVAKLDAEQEALQFYKGIPSWFDSCWRNKYTRCQVRGFRKDIEFLRKTRNKKVRTHSTMGLEIFFVGVTKILP